MDPSHVTPYLGRLSLLLRVPFCLVLAHHLKCKRKPSQNVSEPLNISQQHKGKVSHPTLTWPEIPALSHLRVLAGMVGGVVGGVLLVAPRGRGDVAEVDAPLFLLLLPGGRGRHGDGWMEGLTGLVLPEFVDARFGENLAVNVTLIRLIDRLGGMTTRGARQQHF